MIASEDKATQLSRAELRQFGWTTGLVVGVLFGALIPWLWGLRFPVWPWAVTLSLVVWALAAPATLAPVHRTWMKIGLLISRITTPIVIGIMFLTVITPVALVLKILKVDPMRRTLDLGATTYRKDMRDDRAGSLETPY